LDYEVRYEVEGDEGKVFHQPLPQSLGAQWAAAQQGQAAPGASGVSDVFDFMRAGEAQGQPEGHGLKVQQRTVQKTYVSLAGRALRAGYFIAPPDIIAAGGAVAVPANTRRRGNFFRQWIIANYGIPIIAAEFFVTYRLVQIPITMKDFKIPKGLLWQTAFIPLSNFGGFGYTNPLFAGPPTTGFGPASQGGFGPG
jgi:hypothetical protein